MTVSNENNMADDFLYNERREPYIGEKQKLLRDGYGTYVYENQYFRYEGEWLKGKKHGHGKLMMKDGTYYEGQFINGEINGYGYKYFAFSQSKYTGQFLNGEMHGHGCMVYRDGRSYDGQWYLNKRQGFGVLNTRRRNCDEELFKTFALEDFESQTYDNTYHNLSNGDRYEGNWVMDKRQGHGDLLCADGTTYKGQFLNDMFCGEGNMAHVSGIYYNGMWINGFPAVIATKIVILMEEESPLILCQGQTFSISVECQNDEDELVPETGRELQVIAGFKYWEPKHGSALFDIIEDVEDKPISTPFYDVVPYPLTYEIHEVKKETQDKASETSPIIYQSQHEGEENREGNKIEVDENVKMKSISRDGIIETTMKPRLSIQSDNESAMSINMPIGFMLMDYTSSQDIIKEIKPEEGTPLLPIISNKPTTNGVCEWLKLQLAPPPLMYRPFVIMEEEIGIQMRLMESMQSNEEKEVEYNDDSEESEDIDKSYLELENMLYENIEKEYKEMPEEDRVEVEVEEDATSEGKKSGMSLSKASVKSESFKRTEEKFARPGEYILIVQDVTNPPFMGRRLQAAYMVIQLTEPLKTVDEETSYSIEMNNGQADDNKYTEKEGKKEEDDY